MIFIPSCREFIDLVFSHIVAEPVIVIAPTVGTPLLKLFSLAPPHVREQSIVVVKNVGRVSCSLAGMGVTVLKHPRLHAKLVLIGYHTVVIGSANPTRKCMQNVEAAVALPVTTEIIAWVNKVLEESEPACTE